MIATIQITEKSFGNTSLYKDLRFTIQKGEKIAIIGRNGVGKTTLFHIITGEDQDFKGEVIFKRGSRVASTRQEHHDVEHLSAVSYILNELPEYAHLKHILETYPGHMGEDPRKITIFSETTEHFGTLGFYHVEDEVRTTLANYQIGHRADARLSSLSGGERRFVELVKLAHARADLLLIDEPTNHMDYAAKAQFCKWLVQAPQAVVVITHDRDVLKTVDRIVEIIDGTVRSFPGNYDAYLRQNSTATMGAINSYETALRTLEHLDKQIAWARARKPGWNGKAKKNPYMVMENRLLKQRKEIADNLDKPSFWVDKTSLEQLNDKITTKYHHYKSRNIRLDTKGKLNQASRVLIKIADLELGYAQPLFKGCNLVVQEGDRVRLHGRNGAGKSTLIHAIMSQAEHTPLQSTIFHGSIEVSPRCVIGRYEQEMDTRYFDYTLGEAIEAIYREKGLSYSNELVFQLLSDYLFDPQGDRTRQVSQLSGGQKARLQLIRMLAGKPNVLILDEPTNHLDLPSIEELEQAMAHYEGAILYVSHDSYFQEYLGGNVIQIGSDMPQRGE